MSPGDGRGHGGERTEQRTSGVPAPLGRLCCLHSQVSFMFSELTSDIESITPQNNTGWACSKVESMDLAHNQYATNAYLKSECLNK